MDSKLTTPLSTLRWVDRNLLKPNDYNPNKVSKENLKLLIQSILTNGWTLPIVVRPDMTIIDGFHRWTVAGMEPLLSKLDGKVPVVIVEHKEHSEDIYGTVTHNRARGTHLLEPMKKIVKELMDEGKTVEEIGKQLGMRPEEIFRLSDFSKEDFLKMMTKGVTGYSKAEFIQKYNAVLFCIEQKSGRGSETSPLCICRNKMMEGRGVHWQGQEVPTALKLRKCIRAG